MKKKQLLVRWLLAPVVAIVALASPTLSLRQAADSAGILIGPAVRPSQLSEPAYASTLGREYNLVEPEDAMKWWVVRRTPEGFDFGPGDEVVQFARAHGMKVRGHCLLWARDNPKWLTQNHFAPERLS